MQTEWTPRIRGLESDGIDFRCQGRPVKETRTKVFRQESDADDVEEERDHLRDDHVYMPICVRGEGERRQRRPRVKGGRGLPSRDLQGDHDQFV